MTDDSTPQPSAAELIERTEMLLAAGREVVPLPAFEKGIHPRGLTGYAGKPASLAELTGWIEHGFLAYSTEKPQDGKRRLARYQVAALGIHMATDELALDVDAYGDKPGGRTLADLEKKLGPLPPGPVSTARRPGDMVSGIRHFRVPAGQKWKSKAGPGIEVIWLAERLAVVNGVHHTGQPYQFYGADGLPRDRVPTHEQLPDLPPAWVEFLSRGPVTEAAPAVSSAAVRKFLAEHDGNDHPGLWKGMVARFTEQAAGGRYDAAKGRIRRAMEEAAAGAYPAREAAAGLREAYMASVAGEGGRAAGAPAEWDRLMGWAVSCALAKTEDEIAGLRAELAERSGYPLTEGEDGDWTVTPQPARLGVFEAKLRELGTPARAGDRELWPCPHSDCTQDAPSFTVGLDGDGDIDLSCPCAPEGDSFGAWCGAVVRALGLTAAELEAPQGAPEAEAERRLRGQVEKRKAELRVNQLASAELLAETVPPIPGLTGGTDFLAQQDEDPEFRIDGLWPAGTNVICSAQYKSGKTVLVGNLLRSLLDGDKFLGRFAVEAAEGVTAVIDVEMAARLARKWLNEQSISNSAGFAYVNLRGAVASFNMLDARSRAEWAAKLRDAGCTRLVLDCVGPVLAGLGLDENKATDVGRFIVGFEQMMKEAGIDESFTVHHMGHDAERARGASRLRDWPDAEWRLVRQDANPNSPRYFSAYGRDVDFSESQLIYDEATRHLKISGQGSRKTVEEDAAIDAVSKLLADQPGLSGKGCEEALTGGVGQKAVRNALSELVSRGSIDVQKRGNGRYYYPAPEGKLTIRRALEGPG